METMLSLKAWMHSILNWITALYNGCIMFLASTTATSTPKPHLPIQEQVKEQFMSSAADSTHLSNLVLYSVLSKPGTHRSALPSEIILQIMDDPSRWVQAFRAILPSPVSVGNFRGSRVVLHTPPFTAESIRRLRKVVFTLSAKDQGWSSYREHHGSYENSWTWFDLAIGTSKKAEIQPGDAEINAEQTDRLVPIEELYEIKQRLLLQTNRHAGRSPDDYEIEFDTGEEPLKDLKVGDVILLLACARFSGWVNNVLEAGIEVWEVDSV